MRILAVDDEKLALMNLVDAISKADPTSEIHEFRNVNEALGFARQNLVDVAFLDIEMRELSGIEVAKQLKEISARTNIIFSTGYSEYSTEALALHVSGYILKPITHEKVREELDELRYPILEEPRRRLRAKTFGDFEVFLDQMPVKFQYVKTKEFLAYLIDRRGALCTNGQIMSELWEDEDDLLSHNSYLKNLRADLISTLEAEGCGDVLVRRRGAIGIVPDRIDCDYYDWLDGCRDVGQEYRGEYMNQYSWGEPTHGQLEKMRR